MRLPSGAAPIAPAQTCVRALMTCGASKRTANVAPSCGQSSTFCPVSNFHEGLETLSKLIRTCSKHLYLALAETKPVEMVYRAYRQGGSNHQSAVGDWAKVVPI